MHLSTSDLWAILIYFAFLLGAALYFSRKKAGDISDYFVAGRKLQWWLLGTSMVAATFSADTPLAVTSFVHKEGVAGNWLWWNMGFAHLLAVVFFSKLWRRAGVITDAELIEMRYDGKSAALLRALKSFYFAVPINSLIIGWSIIAMTKIAGALVDFSQILPAEMRDFVVAILPRFLASKPGGGVTVVVCLILVLLYSTAGGLQVTARTSFLQFFFALFGALMIAYFSVKGVGGLSAIPATLSEMYPKRDFLSLVPSRDSALLPLSVFLTYIGVLWWAQKYSDGGGLIIQRMASAEDERQSFFGTLWFCFAHYTLRSWVWIPAALAALIAFPLSIGDSLDREMTYAMLIPRFVPDGLKGLAFASLIAAFLSTIDAQLNWGASYLVNDLYKRFVKPDASANHYLWASRAGMVVMLLISIITAAQMESIGEAWKFLLSLGAGLGLVTLARWFWWRVNAASEIAALVASTLVALSLYLLSTKVIFGFDNPAFTGEINFSLKVYQILIISTAAWLIVTFLTKPVGMERLSEFYLRVRPFGAGWKPVAEATSALPEPRGLIKPAVDFLLGVIALFGSLFALSQILFASFLWGLLFLAFSIASAITLIRRN
ncbi:MAG: Na+:solute symporter [Myxococcota bacterium]